ncbi:multiple monosaccharide ABC transporter permease [Paenibacillus segetis]|uniref:Xylose transport system permease protein XylH n=1 Tax=Paenibacillus segetis TaxID=1325360 RepID=A0ABQ1YVH3_9BACL|nr:multiple monosaccharide ABC transporter permease [Paenibacillus segetis]GGH40418.1 sugar ABC transporter permease [Paenibacillus segetis]
MGNITKLLRNNVRQYGMFLVLILIMVLFQILSDGTLLKPLNITNLVLQNSYILILVIGMLLVIITGHIDLSVGSIAAFIGAMSAIMMVNYHIPFPLAIVLCLLLGALIGAWQGFWVATVGIPSFIVTLAGMLLFRGLTMVTLGGQSIGPFPDTFRKISSGFIPDIPGEWNVHMLTLLLGGLLSLLFLFMEWRARITQTRYKFEVLSLPLFIGKVALIVIVINLFTFVLSAYNGIPNVLVILFALVALYTFIMRKTVMGRHIYAVGGNEKAARLSGVKTKKMTFWVFVNMGVMAALAGLIFTARLNAATPKAGVNFELDAIAACFIGGASAAGGVGTVIGAIIGGLVMGVMNNGMSLIGLGIDYQQGIKGLVLLLAVGFDIYNKNKTTA